MYLREREMLPVGENGKKYCFKWYPFRFTHLFNLLMGFISSCMILLMSEILPLVFLLA